jgi:hypothetical protein
LVAEAHVPCAQHCWPVAPQATHVLPAPQIKLDALHVAPAQQGCPLPPQAPQTPPLQVSDDVLQVVPPQHGCALAPQRQEPPVSHARLAPQFAVPEQQG